MPFWSSAPVSQAPASVEKDLTSGDDLASTHGSPSPVATAYVGDGGTLLSQSPPLAMPDSSQDASPPGTSSGTELNATVSEPWTRIFPEAFGIRRSIEDSSFRWCVRESMLWGVATGTMMGV